MQPPDNATVCNCMCIMAATTAMHYYVALYQNRTKAVEMIRKLFTSCLPISVPHLLAYVRYELTFGFSFSGALVCFFISTFMVLTMAHDSIGTLPTENLHGHIISVVRTLFTLCCYCNEELLSCL